ncbi:hypothetical protein BGX30_005281 [Mortierella sp. GBA39]|nr:hypothetical protein BGX30_005281 [Mortierella sp. GBA39]
MFWQVYRGAKRLVLNCYQNDLKWRGDLHNALVALQRPADGRPFHSCIGTHQRPSQNSQIVPSAKSCNNFSDDWINNLAFLLSLTSLTIDKTSWASLDVGKILAMCSLLKSLHLSSTLLVNFLGPSTSRGIEALPERLPLRSLVPKQPYNSQSWIEDLLMNTPDFEDLKLIGILNYSTAKVFSTQDELKEMVFSVYPKAKQRNLRLYHLMPRITSG